MIAGSTALIDDSGDLAIPSDGSGDDVVSGREGGGAKNQAGDEGPTLAHSCPVLHSSPLPHSSMIQRQYVYNPTLLLACAGGCELPFRPGRASGYGTPDRRRDGRAGRGLVESTGAREGRESRRRAGRVGDSRGNGCGGRRRGHGLHVAAA